MKKESLILILVLILSGCATAPKVSNLNQSTVEKSIVKGKTTKQEVLNIFGAPNVTTKQTSGNVAEIWTYTQFSSHMSGSWATILLLGGFGSNVSARSATLIVNFDKEGIVQDYTVSMSQF